MPNANRLGPGSEKTEAEAKASMITLMEVQAQCGKREGSGE